MEPDVEEFRLKDAIYEGFVVKAERYFPRRLKTRGRWREEKRRMQMEEHECLCTLAINDALFLPFSDSQPHFSVAVPLKATHPPLLAKSETWLLSAVTSGWAS